MLGIDQSRQSQRKMCIGPETATISCVLETAAAIRSPGAYLRGWHRWRAKRCFHCNLC